MIQGYHNLPTPPYGIFKTIGTGILIGSAYDEGSVNPLNTWGWVKWSMTIWLGRKHLQTSWSTKDTFGYLGLWDIYQYSHGITKWITIILGIPGFLPWKTHSGLMNGVALPETLQILPSPVDVWLGTLNNLIVSRGYGSNPPNCNHPNGNTDGIWSYKGI